MYHNDTKCVFGLDSISGHGSVAGSCEHGSEPSCYIIGNDVFSQLSDCQFVKIDSSACSWKLANRLVFSILRKTVLILLVGVVFFT
jgi:hypothetical protein